MMKSLVQKMKALGEENRFRAAMMLLERPLCVCELLEVLDIAGATLSNHLKILKNAGLIEQKKEGRWVVYSPCESSLSLLQDIRSRVDDSGILNEDRHLIGGINRESCSISSRR